MNEEELLQRGHDYVSMSIEAIEGIHNQVENVVHLSTVMAQALKSGHGIFWFGNGGSAGDAQHLAAELVGRFNLERPALRSMALTTDSSILTAVGNDYGFEEIFARQVSALCGKGDVVVGISTSGNSPNVVLGLVAARGQGAVTVAITGPSDSPVKDVSDWVLTSSAKKTCHIQESHIAIGQLLCDLIEIQIMGSS